MKKITLTKKQDTILTFILVFIIVILVNAIVYQFTPVLDFTRDNIYSLSRESKMLVRNLKEPFTVKLFVTPNLPPPFSTYEKYVKDLLSQYKGSSYGKFNYEIIDASKSTTEARDYGIQPSQINVLEKDQTQIKVAYLGLSFIYGKSFEAIPFVGNTEGLEYAMSTMIKKLVDKNEKLVGLRNNIDLYYVVSESISSLLPPGVLPNIPINISEAISSANNDLDSKLAFHNVDVTEATNETLIKELGIEKIKWDDIKSATGEIINKGGEGYFSFVMKNGDDIKNINNLVLIQGTSRNIENEIKATVDNSLNLTKTIGYVTGHREPDFYVNPPEYGGNQQDVYESVQEFANAISSSYTFQPMSLSDRDIPENINALVIVGPKDEFSDLELYRLDQFIMKGRPVMFLLSASEFVEDSQNQGREPSADINEVNTKITDMLAKYGLSISKNIVFDEECYKVQPNQQSPIQSLYYIPMIEPNNINSKSDITKSIRVLLTPFSSEIVADLDNKETKITPLVYTSKNSWVEDVGFKFDNTLTVPSDKERLSKRLIAVSLEGSLKSFFEGQDISKIDLNKTNTSAIEQISFIPNTQNAKIFLATSANIAKNSAFQANAIFVMNGLDWLVSDTGGFMSVRRKGAIYNPPYKLSEVLKAIVRVVNIVIVPAAVVAFGIFLWQKDKRRRSQIKKNFQANK